VATKTVSISARIPEEDAEFISGLQIPGASTPSDKLRALLVEARRRHQGQQDYRGSMMLMRDLMVPAITRTREQQMEHRLHSELLIRVMEWLPEVTAFIIAGAGSMEASGDRQALEALEQGTADRVFRLIESVLQMGVTEGCPCYDRSLIAERIGPVLDLTQAILAVRKARIEESRG